MSQTAHGSSPHLVRRIGVTVSYVICLVGSMIGVGVFGGTPISEAAGGLLSTDATHLAPASPAFSVWTLIYVALGAYTLWQWWDRRDPRGIGWWVALSLLLNAAWILSVQADLIWVSVGVIAVLLVVLARTFATLLGTRPRSTAEAAVADGTVGLYLGWVSVATCANVAAALAGAGFTGGGYPEVWAVAVLVVVAAIGVTLAVVGRGRLAVAATLTWGLAWIAVARTDEPYSMGVAVVAGVAAAVVALSALGLRLRAERVPT
ncbi:TspO/MBR family protein [Pseudactinotalea sp. Z1748]|uniref:TspO/MBR family protein n=1 Tax=Pseudactinotalea sp. Z1748 TaxID=3413027 RepID=UPI003C7BC850